MLRKTLVTRSKSGQEKHHQQHRHHSNHLQHHTIRIDYLLVRCPRLSGPLPLLRARGNGTCPAKAARDVSERASSPGKSDARSVPRKLLRFFFFVEMRVIGVPVGFRHRIHPRIRGSFRGKIRGKIQGKNREQIRGSIREVFGQVFGKFSGNDTHYHVSVRIQHASATHTTGGPSGFEPTPQPVVLRIKV